TKLTPRGERRLDQGEELTYERVALALEQVGAADGELDLIAPLQEVGAGRRDVIGHGSPPLDTGCSRSYPVFARRAPHLFHLGAVVLVDLVVRQARELALRQLREDVPGDGKRLVD